MPDLQETYLSLVAHLRETAVLRSCGSLLGWDEQTCLPPEGAEHRADQGALLAGLVHERATSARIGDWLEELSVVEGLKGAESPEAAVVREARRNYVRATKLPRRLVEELSRTGTLSQQEWVTAKKNKDFSHFEPWLTRMVALKREEAQAVGFPAGGVIYDALLDDYEPGASTREINAVFDPLRQETVKLLADIRGSGKRPDDSILSRRYPVAAQAEFARNAASMIGFSFTAGRLDVSAHPFCSGIGPETAG